jgi:hypothetical protein
MCEFINNSFPFLAHHRSAPVISGCSYTPLQYCTFHIWILEYPLRYYSTCPICIPGIYPLRYSICHILILGHPLRYYSTCHIWILEHPLRYSTCHIRIP